MKLLKLWLAQHPFKAVLLAWFFGAASAAAAYDLDWIKVFLGLLVLFILILCRDLRRLTVAVLLCFILAYPTRPAETLPEAEQSEGPLCLAVVVGVLVVSVGGCATYELVKFCQKHFPKDPKTNAPPSLTNSLPSSATYAAAFNFGEIGSCYDDMPCEQSPPAYQSLLGDPYERTTTFSLRLRVDEDGNLHSNIAAARGSAVVQTWSDFCRHAAGLGVEITGHADGSTFALNGKPISQSECPIVFDPERKVVKIIRGLAVSYLVTVERSKDMRRWVPLLQTEIEANSVLNIRDTMPTAQQFYRFSSRLAD